MAEIQAERASTSSLGRKALRGSIIELVGYASSQALRLGSNLILSRLLLPEAFGLSALIVIFNTGLVMLSDVGLEPCVVQSDRGDEEKFLNTAWVLHMTRSIGLYAIACACAWPMAAIYNEPDLSALIPVGSLAVLAAGFHSTSLFTLRRHMRLAENLGIELISQLSSLIVMVTWAYYQPTVWALVGGMVVAQVVKTIASHMVNVGYRNRWEFDKECRDEIFSFGKWIFGSSALNFVGRQTDRLILGRLIGVTMLGIYSIALFLSEAVGMVVQRINHSVFYPMFSRLRREDPDRLKVVFYKTRLRLDFLSQIALGGLNVLSTRVVDLLYDDRYADAGWMLQAFTVRVAMSSVVYPCETCLLSMGLTRFSFIQNVFRSLWILAGVPVASHLWGLVGIVWVVACSEIPCLIVLFITMARRDLLRPSREALTVAFFAVGAGLGLIVDALWGMLLG